MAMTDLLNLRLMDAEASASASPSTVVLLHGYGCDQTMWDDVAQALPDTRRVLFDWAGAGRSDPAAYDSARHAALDGYAEDLLAVMDELDLHDAVVVGHSVAASIAAIAARQDPRRFGQLAMLSPSPCFLNDPPGYMGGFERAQLDGLIQGLAEAHAAWSRSIAPVVMGNTDRPELTTRLADSFCAMDPAIALRWARATFLSDLRPLMREVPVPCVILQARDDNLAAEAVGHWLHAHLPTSRLVLMQASGHCPHLSAPLEVAGIVRDLVSWRG